MEFSTGIFGQYQRNAKLHFVPKMTISYVSKVLRATERRDSKTRRSENPLAKYSRRQNWRGQIRPQKLRFGEPGNP